MTEAPRPTRYVDAAVGLGLTALLLWVAFANYEKRSFDSGDYPAWLLSSKTINTRDDMRYHCGKQAIFVVNKPAGRVLARCGQHWPAADVWELNRTDVLPAGLVSLTTRGRWI